ncbi:MAG: class I SAM-dependent methyltransferase [Candidatus Thermoplasmatota archaeon]
MATDQHEVWTVIADSFDRTRQRPWPHVVAFLDALPKGSRVLDLMAGNGRHAKAAAALGHDVVAVDWSRPLVARSAGDRLLADARRLPLTTGSMDACIFVAGLHGLADAGDRAACLGELHSVLRDGGTAQITVWSREAPRFRAVGPPGEPFDIEVPWRGGGHDLPRTYHLYTKDSFRRDLESAGFTSIRVEAVAVAAEEPDNLVATART